jgi:hypothetical protein
LSWSEELRSLGLAPRPRLLALLQKEDARATVRRLVGLLRGKGAALLNPGPVLSAAARRAFRETKAQELVGEPIRVIDPLVPGRTRFTTSRLAVFADRTCVPVLIMLAVRKFGAKALRRRRVFPFWADGDFLNETLENVELALRTAPQRLEENSEQL